MWRRFLVLLFCGLALPAWATELVDAQSGVVDVRPGQVLFKVRPFADGLVRPGSWSSLRLEIANGGDSTTASLSVEGTSLELLGAEDRTYLRAIDLPSGARKEASLRYAPTSGGLTRVASLAVGDRVGRVEYPVRALRAEDVGIAVIGERTLGITAITDTWSEAVPGRQPRPRSDGPRAVRAGLVPEATMPVTSAEWSVADWVVWPSADPTGLDPRQLAALRGWVADGGHLFLTVTDSWRALGADPLGDLLPVRLEGVEERSIGGWVTALGGRGAFDPVPTTTASVRADRHPVVLADADGAPLLVAGHYGLGTVHVLLADPALEPLASAVDREALWRALLWLPQVGSLDRVVLKGRPGWTWGARAAFFPDYRLGRDPYRDLLAQMAFASTDPGGILVAADSHYVLSDTWFEGEPGEAWEQRVREYLQNIPGVAPLPLSWLLIFSAVYLLFIGPVDFFVLRALNRQPLTWITFPAMIAVFSAVALVGTSRAKGRQAVLTRFELVDVLGDTGAWRGDTYLGVWSTRKAELSLRSGFDDAVVSSLEPRGTMFEEVVRTYEGRGALEWRAETWTLAYVRSRWTAERPGRAWVEALPEGGWRVHNDLGVDLSQAQLTARGKVLRIGALPDGGSFDLKSDPSDDPNQLENAVAALGNDPQSEWDISSPSWAIQMAAERVERGRGHLDLYGHVGLVGATSESLEPIELTGLEPSPRAVTVVRAILQPDGVLP